MENGIDNLKCTYQKKHFICHRPFFFFKCGTADKHPKYACLKCVQAEADYSGTFKCLICNKEHKLQVLLQKQLNDKDLIEYDNKLNENQREALKSLAANFNKTKNSLDGLLCL